MFFILTQPKHGSKENDRPVKIPQNLQEVSVAGAGPTWTAGNPLGKASSLPGDCWERPHSCVCPWHLCQSLSARLPKRQQNVLDPDRFKLENINNVSLTVYAHAHTRSGVYT